MAGKSWKTGVVKCKKEMMKSFIRRKAGVMKKARELSVLCGVQVALVIFGPDKNTPHVWPQNLENLHGIIGRYFNTSQDQRSISKRAMKISDFIKEDVEVLEDGHNEVICDDQEEESLSVVDDDSKEVKNTSWVDEIDGLSIEKLIDLVGNLDAKLEEVNSRIDMMKRAQQNYPPLDQVVGNVEKVVPLNFQCPVDNYNQQDQFYFDEERASMILNSIDGFDYSITANNNFQYGSQFLGAWCDSDVHVLPLQAQGPIPNFINGMQEQVQSANFSHLTPWEMMLLG